MRIRPEGFRPLDDAIAEAREAFKGYVPGTMKRKGDSLEGVPREKVNRFGAAGRLLQRRRVQDVAHLDDAMLGRDPEIARLPDRAVRRAVDNGKEERVVGRRAPGDVSLEGRTVRERAAAHMAPKLFRFGPVRSRIEGGGVLGAERHENNEPACKRGSCGRPGADEAHSPSRFPGRSAAAS